MPGQEMENAAASPLWVSGCANQCGLGFIAKKAPELSGLQK